MMLPSIRVSFVGPYQSYHLYYSDFREQFAFKWDYNKHYISTLYRDDIREFKWFDTIREAMINCYYNQEYPGGQSVRPSIRFIIDGYFVEDLEFLNFI